MHTCARCMPTKWTYLAADGCKRMAVIHEFMQSGSMHTMHAWLSANTPMHELNRPSCKQVDDFELAVESPAPKQRPAAASLRSRQPQKGGSSERAAPEMDTTVLDRTPDTVI